MCYDNYLQLHILNDNVAVDLITVQLSFSSEAEPGILQIDKQDKTLTEVN